MGSTLPPESGHILATRKKPYRDRSHKPPCKPDCGIGQTGNTVAQIQGNQYRRLELSSGQLRSLGSHAFRTERQSTFDSRRLHGRLNTRIPTLSTGHPTYPATNRSNSSIFSACRTSSPGKWSRKPSVRRFPVSI